MTNLEKNQQMEFSDLKPEAVEPELEKTDCQYCEDVGLCMYCDRVRTEVVEMKKLKKTG